MSNLAVIPARSGSTRLENKNIYPLNGRPLIQWITEAVVESHRFDKIIISTDSDEIFEAVSSYDVIRHNRPAHLATTKSTVLDAMMDLRKDYDQFDFENFAYFLPTCPFISANDIASGADLLESSKEIDCVISMTELKETLQLACLMNGDDVIPVFDNLEQGITNSKFLKKFYKPSGAFYMSKWMHIVKYENFFKGNVKGIIIPEERSVDINNIYDIKYAELLLKNKNDTGI